MARDITQQRSKHPYLNEVAEVFPQLLVQLGDGTGAIAYVRVLNIPSKCPNHLLFFERSVCIVVV